MPKDKEKDKESEKKRHKLTKVYEPFATLTGSQNRWSWGISGTNVPVSPSDKAALDLLRAKYPKINIRNLQNTYFRNLLQMSEDTIVLDRDNRYKMLGAQNLNGVTCFLNATLFAIAFEGPIARFATMVRLWVNMLRSGWFISNDIVAQLRENLAQCGWEVARMNQQQDASECYMHIVELLKLPKSTLQTQFAHGAKSDVNSDHKFETEYLLDCSIPNKPPGEAIFLEECLFEYFTNIVQVRRQLTTPGDSTPSINYSTKPKMDSSGTYSPASLSPPPYQGNGNGFFGVDEKAAMKGSLHPQETNVPAWQFFKLLPYYAPTSSSSEVTAQLANQKPILGICLKRYGYDTYRKQPYRNGRRVAIPKYIELSNFVTDEDTMPDGSPKRYRLVFYSTVCHRGQYVHSGHYVSIVYDRQNEMWLHFDDIAHEKITSSTPVHLLSNETPYLILYQLEEIGNEQYKNPGIHVPPSVPMPEIPPPPSRPPPPIPQTAFISKERNERLPSPVEESDTPPAYQYTEPSETHQSDSSFAMEVQLSTPSETLETQSSTDRLTLPPPSPTRPPPPPPISVSTFHAPEPSSRPFSTASPTTYSPPPPSQPPPPPPEPTATHQTWPPKPTSPPMPPHPPPVPPVLSPIHATGSNGSMFSAPEPTDVSEGPAYAQTRRFNMDDEEDLYGQQPDENGKLPERKHDNCAVQ